MFRREAVSLAFALREDDGRICYHEQGLINVQAGARIALFFEKKYYFQVKKFC